MPLVDTRGSEESRRLSVPLVDTRGSEASSPLLLGRKGEQDIAGKAAKAGVARIHEHHSLDH